MKNLFFFLAIILFSSGCRAEQPGVVKEYSESGANTPLSGVSIDFYDAPSVISDTNGNFMLHFPESLSGEWASYRMIKKDGYEIFNIEALKEWVVDPDKPLVIVMCRSDWYDSLFKKYRNNSLKSIAKHLEADRADAERYRKAGRLNEYQKISQAIDVVYNGLNISINSCVEDFTLINVHELANDEKTIVRFVREGKLNEAIAVYKDMHLADSLLEKIHIRDEHQPDNPEKLQSEIDSIYKMLERQMTLMQLDGNLARIFNIAQQRQRIADADHSNSGWVNRTGQFMFDYLCNYDKALHYYDIALKNEEQKYGPEHIRVAEFYSNKAVAYDKIGDYDKALENYKRALVITEKNLSSDHPWVATACNNLGACYLDLEDGENALKYFEKAYIIQKKLPESERPCIISTCNNIAGVYYASDYNYIALKFLKEAMAVHEKYPELTYAEKALTCDNIATVYYDNGDNINALRYYRQELAIVEDTFGSDSPETARVLAKLGQTYDKSGDSVNALKVCERALSICENFYGSYNTKTEEIRKTISSINQRKNECENVIESALQRISKKE